MYGYYITRVI